MENSQFYFNDFLCLTQIAFLRINRLNFFLPSHRIHDHDVCLELEFLKKTRRAKIFFVHIFMNCIQYKSEHARDEI